MMKASIVFYNIGIQLYVLAINIVAGWNRKAKEWLYGRKHVLDHLRSSIGTADRVIWVHCASAGEFEQGKPIIEQLRLQYPQHRILLTFFSPSGYNVAQSYPQAGVIAYLPIDTRANAAKFLEIVRPELALFVKYEYWYHFLSQAAFRHVPLLLCSAVFRKDQIFFRWYGQFFRQMLHFFRFIFVQDATSLKLLSEVHIQQAAVAGDTRFDRVAAIAAAAGDIDYIPRFLNEESAIVAGSTWPDDEKLLAAYSRESAVKLIVAPHEIDKAHLGQVDKLFENAIRFSALRDAQAGKVLIIDNVGMLSRLYRYARVAYVGGGFTRDGIHNILEAAVYGKPVIIGPNYKKYREARELIEAGGCFSVSNSQELKAALDLLLHNEEVYMRAQQASLQYIQRSTGATAKVIRYIQENRLLTS